MQPAWLIRLKSRIENHKIRFKSRKSSQIKQQASTCRYEAHFSAVTAREPLTDTVIRAFLICLFLIWPCTVLVAGVNDWMDSPSVLEASKHGHEARLQQKEHEQQLRLKKLELQRQQQLKEQELRIQLKKEQEHTKQMMYIGSGTAIAGIAIGIGLATKGSLRDRT